MPTTPRARSRVSLLLTAVIVAACDRGGDEASERNARATRVDVGATIADECPEEAVPAGMERLSLRAADGTPIGAAKLGSGRRRWSWSTARARTCATGYRSRPGWPTWA